MVSFRFAVVFAILSGATPCVAVRSNAGTDNEAMDEDVNDDIKKAFCENFEIEYKVKGKKGTLEHPCCTEAKTCFGKEQFGQCQAQCTVEALAGITSRGIKSHEQFWAPRACVTLPEEKTLVAQHVQQTSDIVVVADEFRDSVRELGKLDMKVYDDHLSERLHVICEK
eukprot:s601_g16.t1